MAFAMQAEILEKKVSITFKNTPLAKALEELSNTANFDYSYNANLLPEGIKITKQFKDEPLNAVLEAILGDFAIGFKEQHGQILLYKAKEKKVIKTYNELKGEVRDGYGNGMDSVAVYDAEGLFEVHTDAQGFFKLHVPSPNYTLWLSFYKAGYAIKQLRIDLRSDRYVQVILPVREAEIAVVDLAVKPVDNNVFSDSALAQNKAPQIFISKSVVTNQTSSDTLYEKFWAIGLVPPASTKYFSAGREINRFSFHALADYGAQINGFSLSGLAGIYRFNTTGVLISGLGNWSGGNMAGVQVGGVLNNNNLRTDGLQIAGVLNVTGIRSTGMQIGGVANINRYKAYGLQFAGVYNFTRYTNVGLQISGVMNHAGNIKGVQVGLLNFSHRVDGLQIGLINYAVSAKYGAQIGLINIVQKNGYRQLQFSYDDLRFTDFSFRTGIKHFYTSLNGGYALGYDVGLYRFGYGIGSEIKIVGPVALVLEADANYVSEYQWTNNITIVGRLKAGLCVNVAGVSFFGTYNFNHYVTDYLNAEGTAPAIPLIPNPEQQEFLSDGFVYQQNRGWTAGFRVFL
jgi:hypothetical protein